MATLYFKGEVETQREFSTTRKAMERIAFYIKLYGASEVRLYNYAEPVDMTIKKDKNIWRDA